MSKKSVTLILSIICAVGLAFSIVLYVSKDRTAPIISYTGDITYTEGDNEEVLLEGVSAYDSKDGDVSDTLMIESIYKSKDTAKIIYCAYDTSDNVSKLQRIVTYNPTKVEEEVKEPEVIDYSNEIKASKITILNGTGSPGVAAYWKEQLEAQGFTNIEIETSLNKGNNTIIYMDNDNYKTYLSTLFPLASYQSGKPSGAQVDLTDSIIVIVIGEDYNMSKSSNTGN